MPPALDDLIARIRTLAGLRVMVALIGPPGAGKSTLAEVLAARLDHAEVVGQDGFHYDDAILTARGLRPRKGAPETFDTAGLAAMLARLKRAEGDVAIPVFDRDLELSRGSARIIPAATRILIVEGNYLLLTRPGWSDLHPLFDLTVALDIDRATLHDRLTRRWQRAALPDAEIRRRVDANDLPNGDVVRAESRAADVILREDQIGRI
ncbi:nucleoside/nucleotide kinase family protein [Paracoccus sp. p4-l81]|uniref:nucleoside/nucleotide kinase family protein n=1 Tax=unclassified Paracoccus (in: a-proteobacteria) TaxID=2688777 RepID=UPI0035B9E055